MKKKYSLFTLLIAVGCLFGGISVFAQTPQIGGGNLPSGGSIEIGRGLDGANAPDPSDTDARASYVDLNVRSGGKIRSGGTAPGVTNGFIGPVQSSGINTIQDLIKAIGSLFSVMIPLVFALALAIFFWGLAKFMSNAGDETGHEEGKRIMVWGIVGLFVMSSIWGIVSFIQNDVLGSNPTSLPIRSR
jgi:hypothetical protein